jgi:hypothetical protein
MVNPLATGELDVGHRDGGGSAAVVWNVRKKAAHTRRRPASGLDQRRRVGGASYRERGSRSESPARMARSRMPPTAAPMKMKISVFMSSPRLCG